MRPVPSTRRALAVLLATGALVWACATARPAGKPAAVVPPVAGFGDAGPPPPEALLAALQERVAPLHSLSATLRIRGLRALPGLTVLADAWVGRPAHAYVGVRGPLGPPMDELITDGVRWRWTSVRPGAGGQEGPADELPGLLPLAVGPHQFVGALLGLPLPEPPPTTVTACDDTTAQSRAAPFCLHLEFPAPHEPMTLWGDARAVLSAARIGTGARVVMLEYLEHQVVAGVVIPARVRATQPGEPAHPVDVRVVQAQLNTPLPDALFAPLRPPPEHP